MQMDRRRLLNRNNGRSRRVVRFETVFLRLVKLIDRLALIYSKNRASERRGSSVNFKGYNNHHKSALNLLIYY